MGVGSGGSWEKKKIIKTYPIESCKEFLIVDIDPKSYWDGITITEEGLRVYLVPPIRRKH